VPGYKQLLAFRTIVVHIDQLTLRIQAQHSMETSITTYHATILELHRSNRDNGVYSEERSVSYIPVR
jgi:hypothetical protein